MIYRKLIKEMRDKKIAVEIPLTSNYIILNMTAQEHPILFYHENKIPIVLSSDDAGNR